MNKTTSSRQFDVVLWGATGFAGKLTAQYLAQTSTSEPLSWAIAARNEQKLQTLQKELQDEFPDATAPEIIVAESFDLPSLKAMAKQTKVICSTVGPYAKYGTPLVQACVEEQTDYCDLTGEVQWMKDVIEKFHEQASEQNVRIVHTCGFDSIPSDLGTLHLQLHAMKQHDAPAKEVRLFVQSASGGLSGGTMASMINLFEEASQNKDVIRTAMHPYSLNPPEKRHGPTQLSDNRYGHDDLINSWVAPFFMASVNTRVVRRSNALMDDIYGKDLRYSEAMITAKGAKGALASTAITGAFMAFGTTMAIKPTRKLLQKHVLPKPGEGPSKEKIVNGHFSCLLVGEVDSDKIKVKVSANRDPGYGATAIMLAESAICLAKDRAKTAKLDYTLDGGILTPASAMGEVLIARLNASGVRIEVK